MKIHKSKIKLKPSAKRWLLRPFVPGNPHQVEHILLRILSTDKKHIHTLNERVVNRYRNSHPNIEEIFIKHYENVKNRIPSNMPMTRELELIIGAYFSQFYALESTALFNPSIVVHPSLPSSEKQLNFILSLRAVGEGHVSSIVFREGYIDEHFNIFIKDPMPFIMEPQKKLERKYEKSAFSRSLNESGAISVVCQKILSELSVNFTFEELNTVLENKELPMPNYDPAAINQTLKTIRDLALSNYDMYFDEELEMSGRVVFPMSPSQANGIEDARFVKFENDDGTFTYYATFTAYNGRSIMPELLETRDFRHFKVSTLSGLFAKNKGLAMFPKKIKGKYMMLGRQDNESIFLMDSVDPYLWQNAVPIAKPTYPWEFVQIGNCSSPIEIEEGWLVLTHGVGAVRRYCIGAMLLDKENPAKVIGRLKKPLMEPMGEETFGYVPNVLYTCGALLFNGHLFFPYAVSDSQTQFAHVSVEEILNEMVMI